MSTCKGCNVNGNYSIKPLNEEDNHPDCPLSEIPMHRGRLIDADAAIASLNIYTVRTVGIAAKDVLGVLSSNILKVVQLLWIKANREQQ